MLTSGFFNKVVSSHAEAVDFQLGEWAITSSSERKTGGVAIVWKDLVVFGQVVDCLPGAHICECVCNTVLCNELNILSN